MQETQVQSLGQEDTLEKEMATHSSILSWKIPWMEKPGRLQPMGNKESDTTEWLPFHFQVVYSVWNLPYDLHLWYSVNVCVNKVMF